MSKLQITISLIYFFAVVACIPLAFDFDGAIDTTWTFVLILLTLPFSLVSILFAWSLIHGAGLEFFTFMYLLFAGINVVWVNKIINHSRKGKMAEANRDDYTDSR
jgi:hypothetical protein